jgi:hypothetical protein
VIDAEVRRIVEESHVEADRLLAEHRDKLDALARALLEAESLNEKEIRELIGPHRASWRGGRILTSVRQPGDDRTRPERSNEGTSSVERGGQ